MKPTKSEVVNLLNLLGFKPENGKDGVYFKQYDSHANYIIRIDFTNEAIDYGSKIKAGDRTTSTFENQENFVVLECIDRLLEKGYSPKSLSLEKKWLVGRKEKGKLDILVLDKAGKAYLMIECKTWGYEFEKEKKKMLRDGGQLFSYFQQDKAPQYLCLYASRIHAGKQEYVNDIVKVDEKWSGLNNQQEVFDHWNKNFNDNGIFEIGSNAYGIEIKSLTRGRLRELTEEDSNRIFNQFAEILRHNIVSDKPNAFNKIFNLFLCKIVDEDTTPDTELFFQWKESDTDEGLQKRLSDLYKVGMKDYLSKEVTDYNDEQVDDQLISITDSVVKEQIREMFTKMRLYKNNEFAFKEVFDEKSFQENARVVREVVELLQPFQIRYTRKQQFLGDFFELLLNTGLKQEAGQFFTPVPIAKFIISSLPIRELIEQKIANGDTSFLPYIIDFAAGSGHFLTEAMQEIQSIIGSMDTDKYKSSIKKRINSWTESSFDWASDYIYGIEADYRLVKTAKVSCFLNGDGLANVIHADGLDNFKKSTEYRGKLKETLQGEPKDNGQFDILAANPPYSVSAFKNTLKNGEQSFELYDRLTDDSSEIECLFIERTKQLLRVGGWAGIILPSSILSNTGIYSDARAIILKYFNIKGITSFGPNTFMATGTNTIVMFMERRPDHDWKKIEAAIKQFFESPKETTVNGIEKAFGKYASEVFDKLSLQDYISFVNKAPNKAMESQELFVDYKAWFNDLTEIKRLKDSKIFKDKAIREQQNELDNLFFKKTFERESEKLLYFFLTYSQKSVVVRMGEKEAEKEFLGYEFSNRRGHEGIKMYKDENGKDSTRLYDDTILLNPEKANTHIYRQFLENPITIPSDLSSNVTLMSTRDLMDFKKVMFENALSLEAKKKDVSVIWDYETLEFLNVIADIQKGTSFTSAELQDGTVPVVAGGQKAAYYHSEANRSGNIITVSASGAYAGFVNYWTQPIFASDCITIKSKDERVISTKLIYVFLRSIQDIIYTLRKPAQAQPHIYSSEIERIKLPILPKPIQAEVLKDLESIEMEERKEVAKIEKIRDGIDARINSLTSENDLTIISKIADVGGGKRVPKGFRPLSSKTDYPYIRVTDFENGSVSMANLKYLNEATFKKISAYTINDNDVYISIAGTIGLVGIVPPELNGKSLTENAAKITILDPTANDYRFLYYVMASKFVRAQIVEETKTMGVPKLALKRIRSIKIPKVEIGVQRKMATIFRESELEIAQIEKRLAELSESKVRALNKHLEQN